MLADNAKQLLVDFQLVLLTFFTHWINLHSNKSMHKNTSIAMLQCCALSFILYTTSLCSASSTRLSTRQCPHLVQKAVMLCHYCWALVPAALDRYVLPVGALSSNISQQLLNDGTDRWMDMRPLQRACSIYYAVCVNNKLLRSETICPLAIIADL